MRYNNCGFKCAIIIAELKACIHRAVTTPRIMRCIVGLRNQSLDDCNNGCPQLRAGWGRPRITKPTLRTIRLTQKVVCESSLIEPQSMWSTLFTPLLVVVFVATCAALISDITAGIGNITDDDAIDSEEARRLAANAFSLSLLDSKLKVLREKIRKASEVDRGRIYREIQARLIPLEGMPFASLCQL